MDSSIKSQYRFVNRIYLFIYFILFVFNISFTPCIEQMLSISCQFHGWRQYFCCAKRQTFSIVFLCNVTYSVPVSAVNVSITSSRNCIQEDISYQNSNTKAFKLASSFSFSLFCFVTKQYHCCLNSLLVGVLQLYYSHCFIVCLCDVLKHTV